MSGVFTLLLAAAAATASPASAPPPDGEGPIGIVRQGTYHCELPGDAAGPAGIAQPDLTFSIESASRYSTAQGRGTYLRRGDSLTLTSGPRQGESYRIVGSNVLRQLDNVEPGRLRCVRQRF